MGKKFVDDKGKEWDLDDFDDTKKWTKDKGFYAHMKISKGKHKKGCSKTLF